MMGNEETGLSQPKIRLSCGLVVAGKRYIGIMGNVVF